MERKFDLNKVRIIKEGDRSLVCQMAATIVSGMTLPKEILSFPEDLVQIAGGAIALSVSIVKAYEGYKESQDAFTEKDLEKIRKEMEERVQ